MRAFIDQINEGKALLLLGDDESVKVTVPVEWLPEGVREGQAMHLAFSLDFEATEKAKARVQSLLDKLGNQP